MPVKKNPILKTKIIKNPINCAREIMNYSSIELTDRFDKPRFNPDKFLDKLYISSPKIVALLEKIQQLDRNDFKKDRKLYKHFIFSDIKKGYGAKILASALISVGYNLVMKNEGSKIVMDKELLNDNNDEAKFAVLSSTALWNNPITPKITKEILSVFNSRPSNIYGDKVRFIILDSGFKEGIDLFDVKYAHIFEDQMTDADLTQSLGRATRFCGQKGLKFKNNEGWILNAYIYKLYRTTPRDIMKLKFFGGKEGVLDHLKKQNIDLQYNLSFQKNITELIKTSAVDKLLNQNINNLKKKNKYIELAKRTIIPISLMVILGSLIKLKSKKDEIQNLKKSNLNSLIKKIGKTPK